MAGAEDKTPGAVDLAVGKLDSRVWRIEQRMGFDETLTDLESRRESGTSEDELARIFPVELLRRVGYWGKPEGAREAFLRLAEGLDTAVVRLVPARRNDLEAARLAMRACAPAALVSGPAPRSEPHRAGEGLAMPLRTSPRSRSSERR